jgi:tetratricopeptide (TPR) repeat protein
MAPKAQCLIVRHLGELRFVVTRLEDGKSSSPVQLIPPDQIAVDGRPDSHLLQDLRWYLERFLDYPFEPNTDIAERVQRALEKWGRLTFERLFSGQPLLWYDRIRTSGLSNLVLKVACDDPTVLAWPWEALRDPHGATLAHTCRLERQLSDLHDPLPLPEGLSKTRVNILLVIARPYGDEDVGFHAVSGPVVDWVHADRVPVRIEVLRPPTFTALQQRLEARPGHYHIVHFDGHGGYGEVGPSPSKYELRGPQGLLVFEDADGNESTIPAHKLTALLTEHRIPIMVLNACQSARIDARAEDPFASTAAALMKAGIRSVVAMSYNLYVSGAQQFVPAFYRRLLQSGDVSEAMRAGRKAMLEHDTRICARGRYPLQDWLVPVLYQQGAIPLSVRTGTKGGARGPELPEEARIVEDYGFIGRQDAIHRLERALLRQPAAAIVVHGMAGIGKTMLAKGFLQWLGRTGGLGDFDSDANAPFASTLWFAFDDIRSAEFVVNRLVTVCLGHNATALPLEQKLPQLIRAMRELRLLVVWDNFESAAGIEGTALCPALTEADRTLLKSLLQQLRGGRSKILITSRSPESWLTSTEVFRLPLRGLRGEDVWAYCDAVVRDLGLKLDRDDADCLELLNELDGHPLALRAVLMQLAETSAREILRRFKQQFAAASGDESTRRIFAALELLNQRLPNAFAPVLQLLGLHQRYVDIGDVAHVLKMSSTDEMETVSRCFSVFERGGFIQHLRAGVYSMHPALHGFLAAAHPPEEARAGAFMALMTGVANRLAPLAPHDQDVLFAIHSANFQHSLILATRLGYEEATCAFMQSLGVFAQRSRDFSAATRLFEALATKLAAHGDARQAGACHQLGLIAQQQRDFVTAERWYLEALAIAESHPDEVNPGNIHHQLGRIAGERGDYVTAERRYQESLAINEKFGDEPGVALTCHQLGLIAKEQNDLVAAERWYRRSLTIRGKLRDEHGMALTYHQLGIIAEERHDYATAERRYRKSLAIKEKHGDEMRTASTYHQLGRLAQLQHNVEMAEHWYLKSLTIEEKYENEGGAAISYHQLGELAEERRDFSTAERWYLKSLAIREKLGDESGTASSYYQLGNLVLSQRNGDVVEWHPELAAEEERDFSAAERWYLKSLAIREKLGDERGAAHLYCELGVIASRRRDFATAEHFLLKAVGLAEKQDDGHGTAVTCYQLGIVAEGQEDYDAAERWYLKSLAIDEQCGDEFGAAHTQHQLGKLARDRNDFGTAAERFLNALATFTKIKDEARITLDLPRFARCLLLADAAVQVRLRDRWQAVGLNQFFDLASLESSFSDESDEVTD